MRTASLLLGEFGAPLLRACPGFAEGGAVHGRRRRFDLLEFCSAAMAVTTPVPAGAVVSIASTRSRRPAAIVCRRRAT